MFATFIIFAINIEFIFALIYYVYLVHMNDYRANYTNETNDQRENLEETLAIFIIVFCIMDLFVSGIMIGTLGLRYFLRIKYYKVYIPLFIFIFSNVLFLYKKFNSVEHRNYILLRKIVEKTQIVKHSISLLDNEIIDLNQSNIPKDLKEDQINSLKETIKLLNCILIELERNYSVVLVNYAVSNVKDVEVKESDLELLQRKVDEFESYRSLSEISSSINSLIKKYK